MKAQARKLVDLTVNWVIFMISIIEICNNFPLKTQNFTIFDSELPSKRSQFALIKAAFLKIFALSH